jgi:hypothetical protein
MVEIEKNGEVQSVKERYLQNFLDRGWTIAKSKKTKPAVKVEAAAEVKPVDEPAEWDVHEEEWAESEEAMSLLDKGE